MKYRSKMPRIGGKKLYTLIKPELDRHGIKIGRDRFFTWLRANDLLVRPKKNGVKTTNSNHRFKVHKNLIKGIEITKPDQVWVSDITYLRLQNGFAYMALITDAYSRKIIGYDISDSLELSGCLRALKMACKHRIHETPIHHSDRGIQYCSNQYRALLKKHNIAISMAQAGNCYENALAERVNGILKQEFNLDKTFGDLNKAKNSASEAIKIYNHERPHMGVAMYRPAELYTAS